MSIEVKISKSRIPYEKAMLFLNKRVALLKKNSGQDLLWVLEHPITYTAGIRSNSNEILNKKIKIIYTNRGGKITMHNPGQKIIYFVLNLNKRKKDIRMLINIIEKSVIEFLKIYNIEGKADKKNIGIWVKNKKIAAIGLKVSNWIAYHGCSININNDLKAYQEIIPCGLNNKKITSVYKEKRKLIKNTDKKIADIFIRNLKNF
jgi:lipoyl(octanoyl) transferase